ncbi:MAG: Uma2 family endonuclease [Terracidiphilus sp.]|jgi:Uma2 family endonuclease
MAATGTLISVEEYLRTVTDPDCEFVRGVLEERPEGEYDHSTWQTILAEFFNARGADLAVKARTELRVQVAPENFRVPDVTLLSRTAPREQIITHPPVAVFEILSPEDTMTRMLEKLSDYERMGIAAIWLIEPTKLLYYRYLGGQLTPGTVFELPGSSFRVQFAEIAALAD